VSARAYTHEGRELTAENVRLAVIAIYARQTPLQRLFPVEFAGCEWRVWAAAFPALPKGQLPIHTDHGESIVRVETRFQACEECGGEGGSYDDFAGSYIYHRCKSCDGLGKLEVEIETEDWIEPPEIPLYWECPKCAASLRAPRGRCPECGLDGAEADELRRAIRSAA